MLLTYHDIKISLRSLKRRLKNAGLFRRKNYSLLSDVRNAIRAELRGPGQLFGYRMMWLALQQKHKLRVKRDDVMRLLKELNPRGTDQRTRRRFVRRTYHSMGPNYLWHVDGYDKLKQFGFGLSGCIDGFSRRVLWLICGHINNDPAVIASYFITCVQRLGVVPMRLRTDCGTENGTLAAIQCTLRHHHTDYHAGSRSHMYGTSLSNQRIESWWSIFRKARAQFWIDLFGDLRNEGHFNGSNEHQCLLQFCFQNIPSGARCRANGRTLDVQRGGATDPTRRSYRSSEGSYRSHPERRSFTSRPARRSYVRFTSMGRTLISSL
ncbi:uncharacterized protein LOC130554804 [Triplophysa rosa]|uniref:uncharacterized protein LOC130554804 n=1 Tax=Triplophysa rosa TaxID=992332 RepID=UPI002546126C|nr:uncharacterized protein LOC130554804 [Triplophysa rosa]